MGKRKKVARRCGLIEKSSGREACNEQCSGFDNNPRPSAGTRTAATGARVKPIGRYPRCV